MRLVFLNRLREARIDRAPQIMQLMSCRRSATAAAAAAAVAAGGAVVAAAAAKDDKDEYDPETRVTAKTVSTHNASPFRRCASAIKFYFLSYASTAQYSVKRLRAMGF